MEYRMSVFGPQEVEMLRVEADSFVLDGIIRGLTAQFKWVWEHEWPGETDFEWRSKVGTKQQFENEFLGSVLIQRVPIKD